jgi:tRNA threonylcarbamoyladenosine biosynthesis protein TsaE
VRKQTERVGRWRSADTSTGADRKAGAFDVAFFGGQTSSGLENVGKLKPEAPAKGNVAAHGPSLALQASIEARSAIHPANAQYQKRGRRGMVQFVYTARSLSDTDRLGRALAQIVPDGTTIALVGTLGSGKTRLVQALASGLDVPPEEVTSPTFVLCQSYHGSRTLYHLDAYRLQDEDEFVQLGPEEYFESSGITMVEWADRVEGCLPTERIEIRIELVGQRTRKFTVTAIGTAYEPSVEALRERLGRTKDKGRRTKDEGQRTKDKGRRTKDEEE